MNAPTKDGYYIGGDSRYPGLEAPLIVKDGVCWSVDVSTMEPDAPLSPEGWCPTATITPPIPSRETWLMLCGKRAP